MDARKTSLMEWRAPLAADWHHRFKTLTAALRVLLDQPETGRAVAVELHRLANQQTGPLEHVKLARLAKSTWPMRARLSELRPCRVVLAGNRTLDFLQSEICGAAPARGLLVECRIGDYASASEIAPGAATGDVSGDVDVVVLMLDEGEFQVPRHMLDEDHARAACDKAVTHLSKIAANLRSAFAAPVIVATMPLRPEFSITAADTGMHGTPAHFVAALNAAIIAGGARGDWIVLDLARLAGELGTLAWFDVPRFHQAKIPFAIELAPIVADRICALIAALLGKAGRALVLDLDNTVWGGVVGDDGVEGIRIGQGSAEGEAFLALQQLALNLRARGIVLAVCSKNDDAVAKRPFTEHPDMLLRLEHFPVFQANWQDKATNVRAIAEALNLGLDALVFVDDNPAERERVRQELPWVKVPELGEDPALFPRLIVASRMFEQLPLNSDDLKRVSTYDGQGRRAGMQANIGNYEDYLRSLQMRLSIRPFDAIGRARIVQLIAKSNQFNLTTHRYNEVQVAAMETDPDVCAWQVRVSDVFGDHGMIGVVIVRKKATVLEIDTWLMSCRVLKRGIEHALMNHLFALASATGAERVAGLYVPTARNGMVAGFYEEFGFHKLPQADTTDFSCRYEMVAKDYVPSTVELEVVA